MPNNKLSKNYYLKYSPR